MIKASSRESRTFRVRFDLAADAAQGLPRGRVDISAYVSPDLARARVDAIYVSVVGGARIVESRAFDDGAVVVDLGPDGQAVGVELTTTARGLLELQGLQRYARTTRRVGAMVVTGLDLGRQIEVALVAAVAALRNVAAQLAEVGRALEVDEVRVRKAALAKVAKPRWRPAASA